jgi:carbon storage regulator CsrA
MLVLTRKIGEEIIIGNNIRLTVLAVRGGRVRLAFTAPPDVAILRKELCPKTGAIKNITTPPAAFE